MKSAMLLPRHFEKNESAAPMNGTTVQYAVGIQKLFISQKNNGIIATILG